MSFLDIKYCKKCKQAFDIGTNLNLCPKCRKIKEEGENGKKNK